MNTVLMQRRVLITGASGSIGRSLALVYAVPGRHLILLGRDLSRLNETVQLCEARGATVQHFTLDLTQLDLMRYWTAEVLSGGPVDLLIANAGMNNHLGSHGEPEVWDDVSRLIDLNLKANMALVDAFLPAMRERGSGQIGLISSLAGYFGLPQTPAYCASKAGLKAYGESLRGWLAPEGIKVSVVMPGYVQSDMCNAMPGPKPFLLTADRAALAIKTGLARDKARISFPFPLNLGTWLLAVLPPQLSIRILGWMGY